MDFLQQNLTILGKINHAIITPIWLNEMKIYEGEIHTELNPKTNLIRYNFVESGIYMQLEDDRLTIYPKISSLKDNFTKGKLQFVHSIFEKLKYTPLHAIGFNFYFSWKKEKIEKSMDIVHRIKSLKIDTLETNKSISVSFTNNFELEDYRVLLINQYNEEKPSTISVNIEKGMTKNNPDKTISEFINRIQEFQTYALNYAE